MRALLFVVALLLAAAGEAAAAERITSFTSVVTIGADSALTVKETIAVVSEGNEIKRGIQRDFPTRYKDRNGLAYVVGFEVLGVKRDGHDELAGGCRLRSRSPGHLLRNLLPVWALTEIPVAELK